MWEGGGGRPGLARAPNTPPPGSFSNGLLAAPGQGKGGRRRGPGAWGWVACGWRSMRLVGAGSGRAGGWAGRVRGGVRAGHPKPPGAGFCCRCQKQWQTRVHIMRMYEGIVIDPTPVDGDLRKGKEHEENAASHTQNKSPRREAVRSSAGVCVAFWGVMILDVQPL